MGLEYQEKCVFIKVLKIVCFQSNMNKNNKIIPQYDQGRIQK